MNCVCFFFFKQKTAYEMCGRDWSSDVCSSDLGGIWGTEGGREGARSWRVLLTITSKEIWLNEQYEQADREE